jgi:hypothetical protein
MRGLVACCEGDPVSADEAFAASERLLKKSREPMRQRQTWFVHAETLLAVARLDDADKLARTLERLASDLRDDRGRGWAHYLLGVSALRRGALHEAETYLGQVAPLLNRLGDVLMVLLSNARLAHVQVLQGRYAEAFERAREAAADYSQRRLRHTYAGIDTALLFTAAAASARHLELPHMGRAVWQARVLRRYDAHCFGLTSPAYLAASALWSVAQGSERTGWRRFHAARELAQQRGLLGELLDINAMERAFSETA